MYSSLSDWDCFRFFNCYLAVPQLTLGQYRGDSLTHPMLMIAFERFRSEGHPEICSEVGYLNPVERLLRFEPYDSNWNTTLLNDSDDKLKQFIIDIYHVKKFLIFVDVGFPVVIINYYYYCFLALLFYFIFSMFDILNENVSFFENRILLVISYLLI